MGARLRRTPGRGVWIHPLAEFDDAGKIARLGMTYPNLRRGLSHLQITSSVGDSPGEIALAASRTPPGGGEQNSWQASPCDKRWRHSRYGEPPGQEKGCLPRL